MKRVLYFAYGSNMDWGRFKGRCPSARFVCRALLPGHCLTFPRAAADCKGGVASVEPDEACHVWGVVYAISPRDLKPLDGYEECVGQSRWRAYDRAEVTVLAEGDEALPLTLLTYMARPAPFPLPPSRYYRDIILRGARRWGLPMYYQRRLARVQTRY